MHEQHFGATYEPALTCSMFGDGNTTSGKGIQLQMLDIDNGELKNYKHKRWNRTTEKAK